MTAWDAISIIISCVAFLFSIVALFDNEEHRAMVDRWRNENGTE